MANGAIKSHPFEDMGRIQQDVNRLFDEAFRGPARSPHGAEPQASRAWSPLVDVLEDENEIVVVAEVAGASIDDMDIEATGESLTIKGERKLEQPTLPNGHFVRVERTYGRFQRSFTIGVPVQHDKVSASLKDGLLTIRLPKSEAVKPKKVQVSAS